MSNDVEIAKKAWMEEGNSAREWNILDTNEQMDYIKKIRGGGERSSRFSRLIASMLCSSYFDCFFPFTLKCISRLVVIFYMLCRSILMVNVIRKEHYRKKRHAHRIQENKLLRKPRYAIRLLYDYFLDF